MNYGVLAGVTPVPWKFYRPNLRAVNNTSDGSGLVQPAVDQIKGSNQWGKYLAVERLIIVQAQLDFTGTFVIGSGGPWTMSLPFPVKRPVADTAAVTPIGSAMCYFSITEPFTNIMAVAVPADPWVSLNGQHDRYVQFVAPYITSWGTATIVAGGTNTTVTHRLGFTPNASDIYITPTNWQSGAVFNMLPISIDTITTTTFRMKAQTTAPNATAMTYNWKAVAEPPTGQGGNVVGPNVPFDWSRSTSISPFGNFFVNLAYEPIY